MIDNNKIAKLILAAIGLCTFVVSLWVLIYPPAIYPDPGWGFKVMHSMQTGGDFNVLTAPDYGNIANNRHGFMSWWSPGQYLIPYVLSNLFRLSIGRATALVIVICTLSGLAGLYAFFRKLGFTTLPAAVSIAFIACQRAYFIPFIFYNGGETTLFAFLGWFLYGCTYFKKADWQMALFVILSALIGFFLKSSFLWIFFAGCLYLWIRISANKKPLTWLINSLYLAIPAIISLAIIYVTFLSKGKTPATSASGLKLAWETFGFPAASPLLTCFSIDDMSNAVINQSVVILVILALASIALVIYIVKTTPFADYKTLIVLMYTTGILFFGINYLRQADISYEARHFRIIGLVITPGIIYILSRIKLIYIVPFGLACLFLGYKNFKLLKTGFDRNAHYAAHGSSNFAQVLIDQPTLNYVDSLDHQKHDAIFVFLSADLGLEIRNNRIITMEPGKAENGNDVYTGHAGPVYMVLPKSYKGAKADIYLKNFPGYSNFSIQQKGNDYLVYSAQ